MTHWLLSIPLSPQEADLCLKQGFIALGSRIPNLPDLGKVSSAHEIRRRIEETLPDESPEFLTLTTEPLWHFLHDILPEDILLLAVPEQQKVHIGHADGSYEYHPDASPGLQHRRAVRWEEKTFPLTEFGKKYRQTFASRLSIREFPDTNELILLKLALDPKPKRRIVHALQILFSLVWICYMLFVIIFQMHLF